MLRQNRNYKPPWHLSGVWAEWFMKRAVLIESCGTVPLKKGWGLGAGSLSLSSGVMKCDNLQDIRFLIEDHSDLRQICILNILNTCSCWFCEKKLFEENIILLHC